MREQISYGGRDSGKSAKRYSEMIANNDYPASVNLFQKNEINTLWETGKTMSAINKLQTILEPGRSGKTLL